MENIKLTSYLDDLVETLEKEDNLVNQNREFDYYFNQIRRLLPDYNKDLLVKLDDSYTSILILYQEFFYIRGYKDALKDQNILSRIKFGKAKNIKKLKLWIKRKIFSVK